MPAPRKLHDKYFKQAKAEGYLARSAFKLKEINERIKLLHRGDRILDLGCAPGSWLQVASEVAGPKGLIVGIDLLDTDPRALDWGPAKVIAEKGDAFDPGNAPRWLMHIRTPEDPGRLFDAVMSDMAPNTSGHGDDLVSARYCSQILDVLPAVLRPGGNATMKIFEGAETQNVLRKAQRLFVKARLFKPEACRDVSRETYIVAQSFSPPDAPEAAPRRAGPPAPRPGW